MDLYIKVLNGPDEGVTFQVKAGIKFGRKKADFIVKDNGASSSHAKIREGEPGKYYFVDTGSKNGTRVKGEREDIFELTVGLIFLIGTTQFEVLKSLQPEPDDRGFLASDNAPESPDIETYEKTAAPARATKSQSAKPQPAKSQPAEKQKVVDVKVNLAWHEVLEEYSQKVLPQIQNKFNPVFAFNPALKLSFVRGVQTDTVWDIGYGPRQIGSHEYDLVIFEPDAPALCFELFPEEQGPVFKTQHSKKVQLNGKPIEKAVLQSGDLITINNSTIKVELIP